MQQKGTKTTQTCTKSEIEWNPAKKAKQAMKRSVVQISLAGLPRQKAQPQFSLRSGPAGLDCGGSPWETLGGAGGWEGLAQPGVLGAGLGGIGRPRDQDAL